MANSSEEIMTKKIVFSPDADEEIKRLVLAVKDIYNMTIECYLTDNTEMTKKIGPLCIVISEMCDKFKANHVDRLSAGICTPGHGFVYNDILYSCGRIADHSVNIAAIVYRFKEMKGDKDTYIHGFKQRKDNESETLYREYLDKYTTQEV